MEKLSQDMIEQKMAEFPEWSVSGDSLQRTFSFETFMGSMEFVNRIAELAEAQQHHPDIMIRFNKVTLTLSTHDATPSSGITERDFAFAKETDQTAAAR
jgi:4a-hydroxytetrahydrobiopterin dehydratase